MGSVMEIGNKNVGAFNEIEIERTKKLVGYISGKQNID
jgi:hypothetical protein